MRRDGCSRTLTTTRPRSPRRGTAPDLGALLDGNPVAGGTRHDHVLSDTAVHEALEELPEVTDEHDGAGKGVAFRHAVRDELGGFRSDRDRHLTGGVRSARDVEGMAGDGDRAVARRLAHQQVGAADEPSHERARDTKQHRDDDATRILARHEQLRQRTNHQTDNE